VDMDISMDIHEKSVDMDMDMDVIFHIHGNPAYMAYARDYVVPVCIVSGGGTMLLVSSFVLFFCYVPSPADCAFEGCISKRYCVTVYGSISVQFNFLFQKGSAVQRQYMVLILLEIRG